MATEEKLGKSLDAIIEENKKQVVSKLKRSSEHKPRGIRVDGGRRKVTAAGAARRAPVQLADRRQERGGSGYGSGLGVQRAGIKKKQSARPAYSYDDMEVDDDEYGMAPARRVPRGAPRAPKALYDRGGAPAGRRPRGPPVPRGDPDGQWSHDLFDDADRAPPRRMAQPGRGAQPLGGRLAGRLGVPGNQPKTTLQVSNLDYTVSDADIKELFSTCGRVLRANIVYDTSGRSEGYAVVEYTRQEDAEAAIQEYNGVKLDGKELKIEFAQPEPANLTRLASGRSVERRAERDAPPSMGFRRAMHDAVPRSARGGGRGGAGPAGRGRLRSGVVARTMRTREELDAEMDNIMQE